jgi:phosphoesterase RecJ-like protein
MRKTSEKQRMTDPSGIAAALSGCKSILISGHRNPDGDALGSQLALMLALETMGKTVTSHNLDPVPETYRFLPHAGRITFGKPVPGKYDAHIVLDSEPPRTGLFDNNYPAEVLINIDHHITNPCEWPLTWLDTAAAATGEMVHALILKLGVKIDRDMALCLYTAIVTDTGSFRYSNTTAESMRVSASLVEYGADPWLVSENVYESFLYRRLKLLGVALVGMERSRDGRTAWIVVTDALFQQTGSRAEDTDNFVNYVRSAKGVEVAVLFRQTGSAQYKISMRSKGRVDLSALAQSFGGGGHKNAAGSTIDGTLEEIKHRVISEVEQSVVAQLGSGDTIPDGRRS